MDPFDLQNWQGIKTANESLKDPLFIDQIAIDSRRIHTSNALFVALPGEISDGHDFVLHAKKAGAKYALVKEEWQAPDELDEMLLLRVSNPLRAFQEIAGAYRQSLSCKILAVTGFYGKTMVKDLLYALLSKSHKAAASPESFNSQLGVPLSLLTLSKEHNIAIIEAGISKQNEMQHLSEMIKPNFGIVTHLGKKHLATLGNAEIAKKEIFKLFSKGSEWLFIPEPDLEEAKGSSEIHVWSEADRQFPLAKMVDTSNFEVLFPDSSYFRGKVSLGAYYFSDLLNIALKAAWKLGVTQENICEVLKSYPLEPIRTEIWRTPLGATFINDSYSSDPQSIDKACGLLQRNSQTGKRHFLFGGLRGNKNASDYARIALSLKNAKLDTLLLYGTHPFKALVKGMKKTSPNTSILYANNYSDALKLLKNHLLPEDVALIKGAHKEPFEALLDCYQESELTNLCLINLASIKQNIITIRNKLPVGTRLMVMVKALAYGTDDLRVSQFLQSCHVDILGVSYVEEALSLIRRGVSSSLFVLSAALYEIHKVVKWDLEVGVSNHAEIQALAKCAEEATKIAKVHLHIDTGMCRFGCRPEEALELAELIHSSPFLKLEGVMTHFASSEDKEADTFTLAQAKKFDQAIAEIESKGISIPWKHAANSGAVMRFHFPQYNMARLGLAVYGLYPSRAAEESLELKLAVSLFSRIVGINHCKSGDTIGYGRTYKVEQPEQKIAVLPLGYFDGIHRNYSGSGSVLVQGHQAPMVGKICMDFMMIDVSHIPNVSVGDSVLIFGENEHGHYLSPEDLALKGNSIIHELITCLGPRIPRVFILEESKQKR